jgi:protein translocase SEC61 complex gamma subunit
MGRYQDLKQFTKQCIRVLKVIKKPGEDEYKTTVKVTGLGIAIMGLIGLIIQMLDQILIR